MSAPEIFLYNSLTGKKEKFEPHMLGKVGMYVCGPTVYDRPHVGNARAVVVYDVLFRLLRHVYGEKNVTYVRNITDVDDKINAAAKANGEPISALTTRITKAFHDDMAALNNLLPTHEPRATGHIKEMCSIIEKLIENGNAYVSEGHVLFSVKTDKNYGQLSKKKLDDLQAGARVEVESYKHDAGDFVLWKPADEGDDPSSVFDSHSLEKHGVGKGRPGWHIECSAMSSKYLGNDFDIHGGGADLKFPHHENEIAQSTCAHKHSHYAKYWVHNGFVTVNGEKMSKSLGNFTTVKDLLDRGIKGEVIRYVLLATKYSEPLDFTEKKLEDAKKNLDRFYNAYFLQYLPEGVTKHPEYNEWLGRFRGFQQDGVWQKDWEDGYTSGLFEDFLEALLDDLNTPRAFSLMYEMTKLRGRGSINNEPIPPENPQPFFNYRVMLKRASDLLGVLGLSLGEWVGQIDDNIESLINQRDAAKKAKNYAEADRIRDSLAKQGIILEDTPSGTTWRKA